MLTVDSVTIVSPFCDKSFLTVTPLITHNMSPHRHLTPSYVTRKYIKNIDLNLCVLLIMWLNKEKLSGCRIKASRPMFTDRHVQFL